ncbi:MAG: phosphomethylpyrimidine synthase ThiC [bacterium]
MTQLTEARKGRITKEMRIIAKQEGLSPEFIRYNIERGLITLFSNSLRRKRMKYDLRAVGKNLSTKVNANIGTSPENINIKKERLKMKVALEAGADAVMDLSTGGDLKKIRKMVLDECTVPVGTVPIYQAVCQSSRYKEPVTRMDPEQLFDAIEQQAEEGVDFITVHCGVTRRVLEILEEHKRVTGIVSRGGAFLAAWMSHTKKENPLYEHYDRLLDIAYKHDVTLSLGDGLRPGCLADATDSAQIAELSILGKLAKRAWKRDVQVMIEGPGHIPMDQIEANVALEKSLCYGAPFYVLGPLVTDVAAGYDHVTCAIGGAIAAACGADFLCYVTPSEHLSLPDVEDVRVGVITMRIAAHAADIAKGVKGAMEWDTNMSRARGKLDWKKQEHFALDGKNFRAKRKQSKPKEAKVCTMCGKFCSMKQMEKYIK